MRKFILLFILLILAIKFCNGQNINIQAGKNWSNLKWENDDEIPGYTEKLKGGNIFLNLDYLNKKYFNLSSGVGFMHKSGETGYTYWRPGYGYETGYSKSDLCYFSVNTTFNIKYPVWRVIPFLNIGPRMDYLISNKNESSRMGIVNSTVVGLILGGGLKYRISPIQIGLQFDYLINSGKIAKLPSRPTYTGYYGEAQVYEHAALVEIIIGYKLK